MPRPLLCALLCLSASAQAASLNEVLDHLSTSNPALAASQLRTEAAVTSTDSAGTWADPMLSVELSNLPVSSFALSDHGMAGVQLRAQQQLHLPGWSAQQHTVSTLAVRTREHATRELEVHLHSQAERAWWELTRARLQRAVTEAHIERADELLSAVRIRYETGRAGQHSVLRLEVLRDRLVDDLKDFAQLEAMWTARLESLTAQTMQTFDTPSELLSAAPPLELTAITELADDRPTQQRLSSEAERLEASASLARLNGRPEPTVWAGYRVRTINTAMDAGADMVSVGVGMPIPTGSRRRASSEEAQQLALADAMRASAASDLDDTRAELAVVHSRWTRAAAKAATYTDSLIPSAQAALDTTFSEFSVDKADFSSLFDAEVVLLDLERARLNAVIDTHLAASAARALTGAPGVQP